MNGGNGTHLQQVQQAIIAPNELHIGGFSEHFFGQHHLVVHGKNLLIAEGRNGLFILCYISQVNPLFAVVFHGLGFAHQTPGDAPQCAIHMVTICRYLVHHNPLAHAVTTIDHSIGHIAIGIHGKRDARTGGKHHFL